MIKEILEQLAPLDAQIAALKGRGNDMEAITAHASELAELAVEEDEILRTCGPLTAEDRVFLARHPERPHIDEIVNALFTDFFEQRGDRQCKEDPAILGGIARFHGLPVTVIGHRKGATLEENLACNFGMPGPEGYRKALRLMKQAEKFGRPIITFIDTPGAYPGKDAEERGQGEAIARNLMEMSGLTVPVIAVVTGEGSSGGALALGVANRILMLENAVYSVLSPEGFASILWKDSSRSGEACEMMKLTAQDLYRGGIVEQVIPEPVGGAQRGHAALFETLDEALRANLRELCRMSGRALADQRYKNTVRSEKRGTHERCFALDSHRRGTARPDCHERRSEPHGGHQRRVDHHPHRHPCPALVRRERIRCHPCHCCRKAGAQPQRPCPGRHRLLHLCHPFGTGCDPQRCLPDPGSTEPAGKLPGAGRERGLLRLFVWHRRGTRAAGNDGRAVCPCGGL